MALPTKTSEYQKKNLDAYLSFIFNYSKKHHPGEYWLSPVVANNIWISDIFLEITKRGCSRENSKFNSKIIFLHGLLNLILGFFREIARFICLKVFFILFKFIKGRTLGFKQRRYIIFTFIDDRCFATGAYKDVFTGSIVNRYSVKEVLIIPVFIKTSIKNIKLFLRDAKNTEKNIHLLSREITFPSVQWIKFPTSPVLFDGIDVSDLLLKEISKYSFRGLSTDLAFKKIGGYNLSKVEKIFYPFENQNWERCLCASLKLNPSFNGVSIALQNAPASLLSLRFTLPKISISDFPAPDIIIARDKVSLGRLRDSWGSLSSVQKGENQREFLDLKDQRQNVKKDSIFVPLSIGERETQSFIKFLRESNKISGFHLYLCEHPLLPTNVKDELIKLVESNENMDMVDYRYGMKNCEYVMATTSTALLEGLTNNLIPLQFVSDDFVSASPLDILNGLEELVSFRNWHELSSILSLKNLRSKCLNYKKEIETLMKN
ncbi:hypothetical protein N9594_00765 [bacterium]|nr:hypothetical protein [bacterium]